MQEEWKEISGYEGYFEVSNYGNFRSKDRYIKYKTNGIRLYHGKDLKVEECEDGYKRIVLMKDAIKHRYMCHRLVAKEFIPNLENKPYINHINGDRGDNRVENLEWCTKSENEKHSFSVLGKTMKGKTYPKKVIKHSDNGDIQYESLSKAIISLNGVGCIEGLNKAIKNNRPYHGFYWDFA